MAIKSRKLLDRRSVDYLKSQLLSADPVKNKRALQFLCHLYRTGYRLLSGDAHALELIIVGLLSTQRNDEKVRRWSLIALGDVGKPALRYFKWVNWPERHRR